MYAFPRLEANKKAIRGHPHHRRSPMPISRSAGERLHRHPYLPSARQMGALTSQTRSQTPADLHRPQPAPNSNAYQSLERPTCSLRRGKDHAMWGCRISSRLLVVPVSLEVYNSDNTLRFGARSASGLIMAVAFVPLQFYQKSDEGHATLKEVGACNNNRAIGRPAVLNCAHRVFA